MSFKKVLLVSPPSNSMYGGLRIPAGVGYIAQSLYDNEVEYEYVDMRIGYSEKYLFKKIKSFQPDLIGISMITLEYKKSYELIERIKTLFKEIKIVVGGHHITILKEQVLNSCKSIDYGIMHDGEYTIIDLCKSNKKISEIPGLIYRENGKVYINEKRAIEMNLDNYSFPKYHKFKMRDYSKQIPIHSSRGCVGQCTFCPNKVLGMKFRKRSVINFVDEIEYWYKRNYKQFAIDDDNFTLIKSRVLSICDEIEKRGMKDLLIRCSNGIRADRVDKEMLQRMMEIGVREVGFGVDGGNDKTLKNLKKGESFETIENAVKIACEIGLDVKAFIIVGTPHETESDIRDSINFAKKYPIARVNFNNAIPYPGTEMYDYVKDNNMFIVPPEIYLNESTEDKEYPVFETPLLSKEKKAELLKECHKIEEDVMKNTALRMYKKVPLASFIIKHFFNVDLFEKLFFKNLLLRKVFETLRYSKLMSRKAGITNSISS